MQSNGENMYFGEELTVTVLILSMLCFQVLIFFRSTGLSFFDSFSKSPYCRDCMSSENLNVEG